MSSPRPGWLPGPASPEFGPALACAALALLAAVQLAMPIRTPLPEDSVLAPRRARPVAAVVARDYPAILAAPLFSPDRKSIAGAEAGVPGLTALGVATGRLGALALIAGPNGMVRTRIGDVVGGWRVVAISAAGVTLQQGGETRTLAIGPAPAAPAAKPNASSDEEDVE